MRQPAGRLPGRILVDAGAERLSLVRRETEPGGPQDAAFRLAQPPGFERIALGRLGEAGARLFREGDG